MTVSKSDIMGLNWAVILRRAVEGRRLAWGDLPVREWRNASDEVGLAVLAAMVEARLIDEEDV